MMAFLHFLTWVWCKFWKAWPTGMKVDRGKNIRLVVLSWRFIVSDTSGRLVVYRVRLVYSLFHEVGSSFRELVSSSCQFDSSAGLLRVWPITDHIGFSLFVVLLFRCFVRASSLHRFITSCVLTFRLLFSAGLQLDMSYMECYLIPCTHTWPISP